MWQLKNFDIDDFLANYWQQKPLLVQQALPGFSSIVTPQELAGLACEEGVHSRLVIEKHAQTPWKLRYGPFKEDDFTSLPLTHYSLLVSECEKWLPELQQLVDLFSFIPKWRMDDLMISYAPEFGSVGPHIDEYDVFLIQASGQRRWCIENRINDNPDLIAGLDLAIMRHFNADQEWTLNPGDMLYLPPKIAHHGVAMGDSCMTYSVGFRAPTTGDILDSFLLEASEHKLTEQRYYDVPLSQDRNAAEITPEDVLHFKSLIYDMLQQSEQLWPDIVGKLLSDSDLSDNFEPPECNNIDDAAQFDWQKHPDSKIYYHTTADCLRIYYNGNVQTLALCAENTEFCNMLCHQRIISMHTSQQRLPASCHDFMLKLIRTGAVIPVLHDDRI